MDIFSKEPKAHEIHQMVQGSSDRMDAPRPWEDRSSSPEERYASYKTVAREHVSQIREAMLREGITEVERTEIRTNPDTQFWKNELEQLLKESPDEFCRRIDHPNFLFLSRYGVKVIDDHTVSFVIPEGVSRFDILKEAQELAKSQSLVKHRDLIDPDRLQEWAKDPVFTTKVTTSERIGIDGKVTGSINKSRQQQEAMVGKDNLPTVGDLAVAFAVYWIATGGALFGWYSESVHASYVVRAADGALSFGVWGLRMGDPGGGFANFNTAVSSRVP